MHHYANTVITEWPKVTDHLQHTQMCEFHLVAKFFYKNIPFKQNGLMHPISRR